MSFSKSAIPASASRPTNTSACSFASIKSTGRSGGSGLGLALVKEIVQAHRGQTLLESQVGYGSTFTVLLPISDVSSQKTGGNLGVRGRRSRPRTPNPQCIEK
ncbi:MAG: hypothetical protein JXM73_09020, partial [Anaerolineae bacterium]|nr:hypothetical protein [Anaerolineae bacterium]